MLNGSGCVLPVRFFPSLFRIPSFFSWFDLVSFLSLFLVPLSGGFRMLSLLLLLLLLSFCPLFGNFFFLTSVGIFFVLCRVLLFEIERVKESCGESMVLCPRGFLSASITQSSMGVLTFFLLLLLEVGYCFSCSWLCLSVLCAPPAYWFFRGPLFVAFFFFFVCFCAPPVYWFFRGPLFCCVFLFLCLFLFSLIVLQGTTCCVRWGRLYSLLVGSVSGLRTCPIFLEVFSPLAYAFVLFLKIFCHLV